MAVPRVWTDASTALQTAKRLGAGSRMRHIDVAALYVQELVYQKQLKVGKASGTPNPSNCFTKHWDAKWKGEGFENLGMVDISSSDWQPLIETAEQIELVAALLSERPKSKANTAWKPNFAIAADALQICILQSLAGVSTAPGYASLRHCLGVMVCKTQAQALELRTVRSAGVYSKSQLLRGVRTFVEVSRSNR